MLFNPKLINLLSEMSRIHHDSRGAHYGESILAHTIDVYKRAKAAGETDKLLFDCIELHDTGKIKTMTQEIITNIVEDSETEKIKFVGHELESEKIARKVLTENTNYDRITIELICSVIRYHMRMNDLRYNFSMSKLAKLYLKVNGDDKALELLTKLSKYDLNLDQLVGINYVSDGLLQLYRNERASNDSDINKALQKVPEKMYPLVDRRALYYCLIGKSKERIIEQIHNDIENYKKFTSEKLESLYLKMLD